LNELCLSKQRPSTTTSLLAIFHRGWRYSLELINLWPLGSTKELTRVSNRQVSHFRRYSTNPMIRRGIAWLGSIDVHCTVAVDLQKAADELRADVRVAARMMQK